jgi:hypothetical protein
MACIKPTRREIAMALSGSAVLLAQAPAPSLPQNADEELKAARDVIRENSQELAKFNLPMAIEPDVHFKA